jgi:hypothetical protein
MAYKFNGVSLPPLRTITRCPGNAPLSRGRKLTRHEGGTNKSAIEPNKRYEAQVKKEKEENERKEIIDSFIEANDVVHLKHFLQKLCAYKRCLTKDIFEYAKVKVTESKLTKKKEVLLLIYKSL